MSRFPSGIRSNIPPKIISMIDFQLGGLKSLGKLVTSSRSAKSKPLEGLRMAYGELQIGLLWAILFGSVIELVVIEIVISNQALKTILLVLGVWSIALVLGVWASFKVNPHELKDDILTIRQGALYSLAIPLDTIESIVLSNSSDQSKCAVFNGTLFLPVMNETNIELILKTPVSPALPWGMTGEISAIKFYVNQATRTLPQLLEMSRSKA